MTLIQRGDISQMSFAFQIKREEWIDHEGKTPDERIIKEVKLYDVSPVTYPAYPTTDVSVRSYQTWKESLMVLHTESPQWCKRHLYEKRLNLRKRR
jgi:hypothetical protein